MNDGGHHRFPSHFYKRGKLFNTYLGYTESLGSRPSGDERRRQRNKKRSAASVARGEPHHRPEPSPGVKRFSEFVKKNLTPEDAARLLRLLARDARVELDLSQTPASSIPMKLAYFAEQHVSDAQAQKYTRVLERRLVTGEPLIQK